MTRRDLITRIERSGPVPDEVGRILRALPEWFGIEQAIDDYVEAARTLRTYVAREDPGETPGGGLGDTTSDPGHDPGATGSEFPGAGRGRIVGVCLVERHSEHSSEIHLLAVAREHHRRGIGRALMQRAELDLAREGQEYLLVKTLGATHPSPEYAATRRFYQALGYRALQEFAADTLWSGNPCLLMVKSLHVVGGERPRTT